MWLTKIILRNIGPFCGEHTLDLSASSTHPESLHLIGGRNGSGKTTILEALYLLWYGSRSPYVKKTPGGWAAYRANLIHEKSVESASVSVEMEAVLRAPMRVELTWDRQTASRAPHYVVEREGVLDTLFSQRWPILAEELLPFAVAPLFWSDGERIAAALETQEIDASFANAVRTVLGLNITNPLLNMLDQIMSKGVEEDAEASPGQGLIQYEKEITSMELRRRVIIQELASARSRLRYILRETVPPDHEDPANHQDVAKNAMAELRNLARGPLALLPLVPLLKRAFPWIQELVQPQGHNTAGDSILLDARDLQLVLTFLRQFAPNIASDTHAALSQVGPSCTTESLPLDNASGRGTVDPHPRSQQRHLARLEAELAALNEQLKRMQQARQRLIGHARRSQRNQGIWARKLGVAIRVKDVLQTFSSQLTQRRLQTLEQNLNDALRLFAYKGSRLGRLRVDPETGQILLVTEVGLPVPSQQLSAGEQQLLLLAMMWGIRKSSGWAAPLIMDTLLARLDLDHRVRLLRALRQSGNSQVILFATDGEMGAGQVDVIAPSVFYLLDYSVEENETQIHRSRYFATGSDLGVSK